MSKVYVFPGQGSQSLGMLSDLSSNFSIVKDIFSEASDALDLDLWKLVQEDEDALNLTKNTQPAMLAAGYATYKVLSNEVDLSPICMAGHSLGEYSALTLAKAFSFEEGLLLVKVRSESMAKAGLLEKGTMAAIIGLEHKIIEQICTNYEGPGIVVTANYNSLNQIVISGSTIAVESAMKASKEAGAKIASEINVSGAFHSPLMQSAREELADKLDSIQISDINIPLYSNFSAEPTMNGLNIKQPLISQLENPVLWFDSINNMINNGFSLSTEIGPGKILKGLNKKINKDLHTKNIELYEEFISYEV